MEGLVGVGMIWTMGGGVGVEGMVGVGVGRMVGVGVRGRSGVGDLMNVGLEGRVSAKAGRK